MALKSNWIAGDNFGAVDLNAIAAAVNAIYSSMVNGIAAAQLTASQTTTSATFVDLATVGPAVTVNIGASGAALVGMQAFLYNQSTNCQALMGVAVSGATSIGAGANNYYVGSQQAGALTAVQIASSVFPVTGLVPGSNTFTAKYCQSNGGTALFLNRIIWVIPFP